MQFSDEYVRKCEAAMKKKGPLEALALVASGRVIVEVSKDGKDLYLDKLNGRSIRDSDHPNQKMILAGSWPLVASGAVDNFGLVTAKGHAYLSANQS